MNGKYVGTKERKSPMTKKDNNNWNMGTISKGFLAGRGLARNMLRCSLTSPITRVTHELHTSTACMADFDDYSKGKKPGQKFLSYNDVVYPPTKEGEDLRPAEFCHVKKFEGSPKKFWYAAVLVRGLSIDEAIRQCDFSKKIYPKVVKEVLLEAHEKMMKECNVEFASNVWVADSFVCKAGANYSARRVARGGVRKIEHPSTCYFVRLREGQPPEHYYPPEQTGYEKLRDYISEQRARRIKHSL